MQRGSPILEQPAIMPELGAFLLTLKIAKVFCVLELKRWLLRHLASELDNHFCGIVSPPHKNTLENKPPILFFCWPQWRTIPCLS
jgi:hypothetical protein